MKNLYQCVTLLFVRIWRIYDVIREQCYCHALWNVRLLHYRHWNVDKRIFPLHSAYIFSCFGCLDEFISLWIYPSVHPSCVYDFIDIFKPYNLVET